MNPEKLKQLQAKEDQVRTGGKGSARRKNRVIHRTATTDDKKSQNSFLLLSYEKNKKTKNKKKQKKKEKKKLSVNSTPGTEEVNMIREDGRVIHLNNPKVQASPAANTFAITSLAEMKQIAEMLPGILNQLGTESPSSLRKLA